jgi:hypothetical protein
LEPLLTSGKPCYLVAPDRLPDRDYTGGEVVRCVSMLQEQGLCLLPDQLAVIRIVQTLRKGKDNAEIAFG